MPRLPDHGLASKQVVSWSGTEYLMPLQPSTTSQGLGNDKSLPQTGDKRPRQNAGESRYPRKRSLKACRVCRGRKTKCDNVQPICGFCASLNITCSYDDVDRDHSSFDPASLEILRRLAQITESQDELLQLVRHVCSADSQRAASGLVVAAVDAESNDTYAHHDNVGVASGAELGAYDWFGPQPDSASSTPSVAAHSAAIRWLGVLTNDPSGHASAASTLAHNLDDGFLRGGWDENDSSLSALQRATRAVDEPPVGYKDADTAVQETLAWQAAENILLLEHEQALFNRFLRRICSWFEQFDPMRLFSTRVPHLAIRNAGLLNAILALSSYHLSLEETTVHGQPIDQSTALQYYYQTLHYVQKAMQYSSYRSSLELTATTIIVSTYEMLHGSSNDWQRHLQGVFWMLRSRQIEVERSSLESTIWWAWLQQDIWAAFRERRRTYSTWTPKKACRELESHELAGRALWILAQVVNYYSLEPASDTTWSVEGRIGWAKQLHTMLEEWESSLTTEFSPLPAHHTPGDIPFKPLLIHPQSYGLAVQAFYAAKLLLCSSEPCSGGTDVFMRKQKAIQESIDTICGIGLSMVEDAGSLLSSQYVFVAGLFAQDSQQRLAIQQMLDDYQQRCYWPVKSLSEELSHIRDGV